MAYDAVKAHEYYVKYRKKGLKKGRKKKSVLALEGQEHMAKKAKKKSFKAMHTSDGIAGYTISDKKASSKKKSSSNNPNKGFIKHTNTTKGHVKVSSVPKSQGLSEEALKQRQQLVDRINQLLQATKSKLDQMPTEEKMRLKKSVSSVIATIRKQFKHIK